MKKLFNILAALVLAVGLGACSGKVLQVSSVGYRSVRTSFAQPERIPDDAKIAVEYFFTSRGGVIAEVRNLTDATMTVDRSRSSITGPDGSVTPLYDPAVAAVLPADSLAGQPTVTIEPKERVTLAGEYIIPGLGESSLGKDGSTDNFTDLTFDQSPLRFTIAIAYTAGSPATLATDFYVNSKIIEPVTDGKVSAAFRKIYTRKPDVLAEPSYLFVVNTNLPPIKKKTEMNILGTVETTSAYTDYRNGSLIDYQ